MNLDANLHSTTKPKDKEDLQKVLKSKSSIILKNMKNSSVNESKKK